MTLEFNKQKIIDAIELVLKDSEKLLGDLYVMIKQKETENKQTPFYKKLFSWNYSNIEFIVNEIHELKHLIRTIKDIQSFLSSSESQTVTLDYSFFKLLSAYYKK